MTFSSVIGLEVHVQLNTKTKLFCSCTTKFGAKANTQTCPICQGHPGVLPVLNKDVLIKAIQAGLALNCSVNYFSKFDRKNFFYPDMPKAYQISQFDLPIVKGGYLDITLDSGYSKTIRINRIHIEEDAGKLIHSNIPSINESYVDLNRSGVPLLEIVSEADIRTSNEAYLYLQSIKSTLEYIGVSDCNMEEGSLRCDANISLRPVGQKKFGTKAEIKNLNSFKNVQKAIEYEIKRQTRILENNELIVQETRLYNADENKTYSMRSKEEAHDYRYFPDPDLVPIVIDKAFVSEIRDSLPELPNIKLKRFINDYGLSERDSKILISSMAIADYYESVLKFYDNPKKIANWIMGEFIRALNDCNGDWSCIKIKAKELANLVRHIDEGKITSKMAKDIFYAMVKSGDTVENTIDKLGLRQLDESELNIIIDKVINDNPKIVSSYRAGKDKAIGALVGQVMKATKGQANPKAVNDLLKDKLIN